MSFNTKNTLSNEQIKIIEENAHTEFGRLALFLLYSSLRKDEALALTYNDVDFENNTINVNKALDNIECEPHLTKPKTAAAVRAVPLGEKIKEILENKKSDEIIFSQNGEYMSASYFREHWQQYKKQTNLNVSPHQFRNTFITRPEILGIDISKYDLGL